MAEWARFETRTGDLALQDRELVAQDEKLDILGTVASTAQHQEVEHEADKTIDTGHAPILAASEPDRSHQRVTPVQYAQAGIRHPQPRGDVIRHEIDSHARARR